jgi:hypothetical protein
MFLKIRFYFLCFKSWQFCVFYLQCIYFWPTFVCLHPFTLLCAIWDNSVNLESRLKKRKHKILCVKNISIPSYIHSCNFLVCFWRLYYTFYVSKLTICVFYLQHIYFWPTFVCLHPLLTTTCTYLPTYLLQPTYLPTFVFTYLLQPTNLLTYLCIYLTTSSTWVVGGLVKIRGKVGWLDFDKVGLLYPILKLTKPIR